MKIKIIKANCLSIIPLFSCSLLIACNSGNANVSNVTKNNVLGLAVNNNIIKETISNLPSNCVEDDVSNPTVETCFYMPNGKNGQSGELSVPSFAKYIGVVGAGGGGGGGGNAASDASMYNGGGKSGSSGDSGIIAFSANKLANNSEDLTVAGGGGGGGGAPGSGSINNSKDLISSDSGGDSYAGGGASFANDDGGDGGGGGGSFGLGGTGYSSLGTNGGGASGGYGDAHWLHPSNGGGGGGGGQSLVLLGSKTTFFAADGGAGGDGGDGGDGAAGAGGAGGNSYLSSAGLPSFYNGTYKNLGSPNECNEQYNDCAAYDGGAGFAIVTLSESPVVSKTNLTLNFVSTSQNNVCMLIKDNTDDTDVGKRSIEVACSNNGHPVYIKTLAGAGAQISATDDGSVIHIVNSSNKSLEFHLPLITNIDTAMNERFEYKSVLQEEKFADSNNEYKTTVVTSDVRYDPTDPTKVVETKTLASSGSVCTLTHGNLSCSSSSGYGFALPSGSWINDCYGSHYDGVTLTAMCGGLEQSQFATPGTTSNCQVIGGSLTCTDGRFKYPGGTTNYETNIYPSWLNWNFKRYHFGGDILLSGVSASTGKTSTVLVASGSDSYCHVVGNGGFMSCKPNELPGGGWLQDPNITGVFYDGYNFQITRSGSTYNAVVSPDSGSSCSSSDNGISCD